MPNKFAIPLLAVLALQGQAVRAQSTSESLTRIEAETLVLKARERQLDVQASIVAKQNDIASRQNQAAIVTQPAAVDDPVVRGIEGVGSKLFATLQMGDGSMVDVQPGDVLGNGMTIVSIGPREVVARARDKRRVRLGTYGQQPVGFNPNYPGTGLSLPAPQLRGAAR